MENSLFLVLLVVGLLEGLLSGTWSPFYFSIGLPIYRREKRCLGSGEPTPSAERLQERLAQQRFPSLLFRVIDTDTLAFREKLWGEWFRFSYSPVMHGRLEFDRRQAVVRVTGLANWFAVAFPIVVARILIEWGHPAWWFMVFVVGLFAVIYTIQAKRFARVASTAAAEWSHRTEA